MVAVPHMAERRHIFLGSLMESSVLLTSFVFCRNIFEALKSLEHLPCRVSNILDLFVLS